MIQIKHKGTGSWLDPRSTKALAAKVSSRLVHRCKGEKGLVLTLTYRRDEYQSPQQLYREASEKQHVPLFLRKVGRHLGESLTGRWFCKLEFQAGGWIHYHIILLGVTRIPHRELMVLWGRGHVWVDRMTSRSVSYVCKYISKGDGVPAWIYAERPRSVKIIRVSPGFWCQDTAGQSDDEVPDPDELPEWWFDGEPDDDPPRHAACTVPIYESIGTRIESTQGALVLRDHHGQYEHASVDLGCLLVALLELGCGVIGKQQGWLCVDARMDDIYRALARARTLERDAQEAGVVVRPRRTATAGPLHLIKPSIPDGGFRSLLPAWLDEWYRSAVPA